MMNATKRLLTILAALLFAVTAAPMARAELAGLGTPIDPHGYPAYYEDTNGLQLEPCLPPPAGHATRPELCVFDPLDPNSPIYVAGEIFWWLAVARIDLPGGGRAEVTLGIEGTFGGDEAPIDGQQISFGRTRITIDTPSAGTYTVTHPFGEQVFEVTETDVEDGVFYTADIGSANFLNPINSFNGTLSAPLGPFLTWPDYATNETLQVRAADGVTVLEQYVGNPAVLSTVVGSPNDTNFFRVVGPGINVQTDQFSVMGKVFDPTKPQVAHVFPPPPAKVLFAVGPVNREIPFAEPTTATVTGVDNQDYPLGYPIWYQENAGTIGAPVGGLKYTLCNPGPPDPLNPLLPSNPMCISDPIDPENEAHTALRTGGEGFWWSADALIDGVGGDQFLLVLGLEATFGGDESLIDGQQIAFTRERIRIDTNESGPGTYRITHPYGQRVFEDVPADDGGINFTADIGIADQTDPDGAFVGALYALGPQLLKWTTFNPDPALTDENLIQEISADPPIFNYYVGNPGIDHEVVGSPTENNFFRVEKLASGSIADGTAVWTVLGETNLFAVSGQVFDPATAGIEASLNVTVNGNGTVTSAPVGIDCGLDCTEIFPIETSVTLTATAGNADTVFAGWDGACTGTDPLCTVTVDAATAVTATFVPLVTLTVETTGEGAVASNPAGAIACGLGGIECTEIYPAGTSVTLVATGAEGFILSEWTGACTGANPTCTFTITDNVTASATFVTSTTLTVAATGNGSVTSDPAGAIDCGNGGIDCSELYPIGAIANLVATPATDWAFASWSGACTGTVPTCAVTMSADQAVTATFVPLYTLTVATSGNGTVTSDPVGIACGLDCSEPYPAGTTVTLTAAAAGGSLFAGWGGACDGAAATCNVTMDAAKTVNARFILPGDRINVFRAVNGLGWWYLDVNGNQVWNTGIDQALQFGTASDIPVPGDWNGNGATELGVFRKANGFGYWYFDSSGNRLWNASADTVLQFGLASDTPVPGDWNGNGSTDLGVFRNVNGQGRWYLDSNGNRLWDAGSDQSVQFGLASDTPITGDWNSDGSTDLGVFRNVNGQGWWYLDSNGNKQWDAGSDQAVQFGLASDTPITGDWNNDGITDIGVIRQINGLTWWYLDSNGNKQWDAGSDQVFQYGQQGDIPTVGVW